MAERKKPQTDPVPDSSHSDADNLADVGIGGPEMSKLTYNSVIRGINRGPVSRAWTIRTAAFDTLKRLGLKATGTPYKRTPAGSDHLDVQSVVVWMHKVTACDKKAIKLVQSIYATAKVRTS